ncbi:MAG TPA: glycosyltransferase, partial [Pirellula sp.]|nr:glycosyltransferase [Pirellula sp.]
MITGVILTHNEQANIVECIKHLRPHVSELFLLDTDSTDQTVELARPLVDRVLMHPHVPNFDSARNIAIPEARNEWLWFVDADEFVPKITGELVNQWIRDGGETFEAINIPFKSYFCGQWMQHCGWWPGYTCARVLKRGHFKFSATLHGGVELNGREVRAPANAHVGIEHRSFRDLHHWIEKFNRYTSTESLQLANRGIMYDWRGALRFMVHDLWEHYEKFEARLDGERGWILTWCAGLYRWMSVAKLIDHGRSEEQMGGASSVPADLDEFVAALKEELACFRKYDPTFPLGIVLRAPVWDETPASQEARQWIRQLACESRTIVVESLPSESHAALNQNETLFLKALENGKRSRSVLTMTYWCNCVIVADPCASFNVLRFSNESRFDASQIPLICQYNELWAASESQLMKLRELGASPERIRFVPYLPPSTDHVNQHVFVGMLVSEIEISLQPVVLSAPVIDQVSVTLEGEFYAGHSFSNINEQLAERFARDPRIALSLSPSNMNQLQGERLRDAHKLRQYFGRQVPSNDSIILRHAFPPNWEKPASGVWVHIQPWEFGHLPNDWIDHLRNEVDEIWVMSRYVEQVYINSGVDPDKIRYIPWGVDESIFELEVPKRDLPTKKTFRFLYVGGTILRKGFDRVLEAYLQEFTAEDDVCLVVKDVGTNSFYQPQSMQSDIRQAQGCPTNPQIIYYSEDFSPGHLASLYTACNCIVAPYRGEGFGLPILEAMACGLAPIVPVGGPTDDFVTNETGYFLPTQVIPADGVNNLCGPATEFHVSIDDLRSLMRQASTDWATTRSRGLRASQHVRSNFTWDKTARQM